MSPRTRSLSIPATFRRPAFFMLMSLPFAGLSGHVQAQTSNTPPTGYVWCANESSQCRFSGSASVVYGARTTWTTPRNFSGGTACSNSVFGDPLSGVLKACYLKVASAPAPAPAPSASTPPVGYSLCASENQRCNFSGAANVVYGARTTWTSPRSFSGGVTCSNATFG